MKRVTLYIIGLLIALAGLAWAAGEIEPRDWGDVIQYALTIVPALIAAVAVGIRNWPELIRSKTFWAGVSAIIAAVQQYAAGAIDLPTLIWALLAGLALIFVRDAQATASKAAEVAVLQAEVATVHARDAANGVGPVREVSSSARADTDPSRRI